MSNENNFNSNETPVNNNFNTAGNDGNYNGNFYSPAPEPPVKKKKWPVAAGIAGALVVAGAAAGACWFIFRTPSFDTPVEAVTSCMSQLGEQFSAKNMNTSSLEKKLDSESMLKNMSQKGSVYDISLTLEDTSSTELSAAAGMTFGLTLENDIEKQISAGTVNASMFGMGGDIRFYTDDSKLALASEEFLPDSYLYVDRDTLLTKLKETLSEEELEQLRPLFEQESSDSLAGMLDFKDYVVKQLPDSLVSFAKDWDINESDKKDTIKINDTKYDCYTYEVSISEKAFQKFVDDYCTYLAEYNYEENSFFSTMEKSIQAQTGTDEALSDLIRDGLDQLPETIGDSEDNSLDFELYISKKGELLGFRIDSGDSADPGELKLLFGGENPGQEISFTFESDSVHYTLESATTSVKDKDRSTLNMSFDGDSDITFELSADSSYSSDDDSFEMDITFNADPDGENIYAQISADGIYNAIEEGTRYTIVYDNFDITASTPDTDFSLELSGSMTFGVLDEDISKPSGNAYDLLNLTSDDITSLLDELKDNSLLSVILSDVTTEDVQNLIDSLMQKFLENDFIQNNLESDLIPAA